MSDYHTKKVMKLTEKALRENKLSENDIVYPNNDSSTVSERVNKLTDTASKTLYKLSFEEWKAVIEENFPKLIFPAELGLSLFGQLLIKDIANPCAVVLVDSPSAGKTIVLNLFSGVEKVYSVDNFTPASFVSQAANVSSEKLKDVDMLPKIKDKVLIIRDMAPMFGQRDDDLLKNMGMLTRVLDGEGLELHGGVHGGRGYQGDYLFMILAASTPISPRIFKLMGNLGSRLFFLTLRSESKGERALAQQLIATSWKQKQSICKKATNDYLSTLWQQFPDKVEWDKNADSEENLLIITRCARLLAKLRGAINLWKEGFGSDEFAYQEPVIEMPDRISQVLYNLARGHALISGRKNIDRSDLKLILNVAFDSAPLSRARLFRLLTENDGVLSTDKIIELINCSRPTAIKEMEVLKILGLVSLEDSDSNMIGRPSKIITLNKEHAWFMSEECKTLLTGSSNENSEELPEEIQEILAE